MLFKFMFMQTGRVGHRDSVLWALGPHGLGSICINGGLVKVMFTYKQHRYTCGKLTAQTPCVFLMAIIDVC